MNRCLKMSQWMSMTAIAAFLALGRCLARSRRLVLACLVALLLVFWMSERPARLATSPDRLPARTTTDHRAEKERMRVAAAAKLANPQSAFVPSFFTLGSIPAPEALAPVASSGTSALLTAQGSSAGTSNGDYVTGSGSLNTFYRFFIEVPPGLSRLVVEIFDPDIGRGGSGEAAAGRDRDRDDGFETSATYTLLRPDGTTAATLANCNSSTCTDNDWQAMLDSTTAQNTAAGHWELRVAMSAGNDINAFGLRAHDGTSGAGGTKLNIYVDSIVGFGVNPPASGTTSRNYTFYPYVSSGCTCSKNDFDYDSNSGDVGSMTFTSRSGSFTQSYASASLSANQSWRRDSFSGWTSDQLSADYGIWSANLTITSYLVSGTPSGNYANLYLGNYQAAANPPTANPVPNAFRLYLPTDAGTAPVKPYVEQDLIYDSGPNPPVVGQTTEVVVTVRVVNPTAQAITFSASHLVTANVPGGGAVYGGNAHVSQGTLVSQPAVGGTGNITWNPGTVAAGESFVASTAVLVYHVKVTPTSAGQRIPVTGTPASGNGTRAQYVDETGNTTQARATFLFGPLCELAVTQSVLLFQFRDCPPNLYSLSPSTVSLPNVASTGQISVFGAVNCSFGVQSNDSWITITSEGTNFVNSSVSYSVASNSGPPRDGTITIADHTVKIHQQGPPSAVCTYAPSPTSTATPVSGGTGNILIQTLETCRWTAISQESWITLTSAPTGTGIGAVSYAVEANPGTGPRTGVITIEDSSFTLTQAGSCGFTLSPATAQSFTFLGGSRSVGITSSSACQWAATSSASFVSFNPSAGSGQGNIELLVAPNPDSFRRTATISIGGQSLTVLQGAQFADVPPSHPFFDYISQLSALGITAGCGSGNYCPDAPVTREQMSAFLLRSLGEPNPPAPTQPRFTDVALGSPFAAFIEQMAVRGITGGCGGGNYCPDAQVTREQMAAFLIRALHAPGYAPATPVQPRFADVPLGSPFAGYIEELAVRGITAGCGGGNYCPGAVVTRGQMAVFLVKAFGL